MITTLWQWYMIASFVALAAIVIRYLVAVGRVAAADQKGHSDSLDVERAHWADRSLLAVTAAPLFFCAFGVLGASGWIDRLTSW